MGLRHWKYVSADTFMGCLFFITYSGSSIPPVRQRQKQSLGSDADSGSPLLPHQNRDLFLSLYFI